MPKCKQTEVLKIEQAGKDLLSQWLLLLSSVVERLSGGGRGREEKGKGTEREAGAREGGKEGQMEMEEEREEEGETEGERPATHKHTV